MEPVTVVAAAIGVGPEHGGSLTAAAWMLQVTGVLLFEVFALSRRRVSRATLHEHDDTTFTDSALMTNYRLPDVPGTDSVSHRPWRLDR